MAGGLIFSGGREEKKIRAPLDSYCRGLLFARLLVAAYEKIIKNNGIRGTHALKNSMKLEDGKLVGRVDIVC